MKSHQLNKQSLYSNLQHKGYALPEVMVSSVILAATITTSLQLTGSTLGGMNQSQMRSIIDNRITERIEGLRIHSFRYLCATNAGCQPNKLSSPLNYDDSTGRETLKELCKNSSLGSGLKEYIISQDPLATSEFEINHAGRKAAITPSLEPDGHRLNILYSVDSPKMAITTTLVAHAQGWCP